MRFLGEGVCPFGGIWFTRIRSTSLEYAFAGSEEEEGAAPPAPDSQGQVTDQWSPMTSPTESPSTSPHDLAVDELLDRCHDEPLDLAHSTNPDTHIEHVFPLDPHALLS